MLLSNDLLNILSLGLFLVFIISYSAKLVMLKRKFHIQAHVLGNQGKEQRTHLIELGVKWSSLCWGLSWGMHSLFGNFLLDPWFDVDFIQITGLILAASGLTLFIAAMLHMRTSWRVGIDPSSQTVLIITGIYRFSRNPAFVGFDMMFIGLFLMFPNMMNLVICCINLLLFDRLIRMEEMHLSQQSGHTYLKYAEQTPRYFWMI